MSASLAASPAAAPAAEAGSRKWAVALTVSLGALLEIVDTSIVNVALTDMQATLGATLSEIGWVVTSYGIANVIILPLSAWLGDRFGKKRYFVFSLVAFTAASMLCGLASSLPMLVAARVLQGLFGGGLLAKAQSILFETFPKEEHAKAQGVFGAVVIAGPALGPTLGGYITTHADWRWIFFVNLPVGIAATLLALAFLPGDGPPSAAARRGIDWPAIALLALGLGGLQTLLEEGQSEDWFDSPFVVACAVAAVIGLAAFVARQLKSDRPVVDLRVLRHRSLWAGCLVSTVVGMGLYGTLFSVPIFAQSVLRLTPQQTGMLLLPGALASAATMPLAARLSRLVDPRLQLTAGALIIVASMAWLNRLTPQTGVDHLFWPLIVRAAGTVLMFIPLSLAALGSVPKAEVAAASGLYNLTRQLGGSIGIALLAFMLERREAFHRSTLVERLVASDVNVQARLSALAAPFLARGADAASAKQRALALLDGVVNLQAAVLSFADTFAITGALFVAALPLFLLLGRGQKGGEAPPAH